MNTLTPTAAPFPSTLISEFETLLASLYTRPKKIQDAVESIDASAFERKHYTSPALFLDQRLFRLFQPRTTADSSRLRGAAIAALCLRLPQRIEALRLPDCILSLYPRTLNMIFRHLALELEHAYPTPTCDFFLKDARIVTALSVPCGAQYVDLKGAVRLRSLLKHAAFTGQTSPLRQLATTSMLASWFEIHTDPRDLDDFNEPGWDRCYGNIAQLLANNPSVAGMVGTSWFYDPQLIEISPRIAYLQRTPIRGGALQIRNGPAPIHTERATSKSDTRRRLYQEGKYLPVCYTIIWPREKLLAWFRSKH